VDPPRRLPDVPMKAPDEPPGWFDKPRVLRRIKIAAWLSVAVLFVLDFFLHFHEYVGLENVAGFYTVSGFIASVLLIGVAKTGGSPLKREVDYYE
jgi:hypothetical protein